MTFDDAIRILRWCIAHPREALDALLDGGWKRMVDTAELGVLADLMADDERTQAEVERRAHDLLATYLRESRAATTEVNLYVGSPLFAMSLSDERWRVN